MEPMRFGQILRNFHLISEQDLNRCLHLQNTYDQPRPLGKILLEQGLIDLKLLSTILQVQKRELHEGVGELGITPHEVAHRLEESTARCYIQFANEIHASDLYLTSGKPPMVRLHGTLTDLPKPVLTDEGCEALILELLSQDEWDRFRVERQLDVVTSLPDVGRFRLAGFRHRGGIGATIRMIRDHAPTLDELGVPASVAELSRARNGLILVTGTAGSGKTSTVSALVREINRHSRRNVMTFEDPITTLIDSERSMITQRQIGTHVGSIGDGIQTAMREDADVIVVSSLRDPKDLEMALVAAETGHLVIGSMHTRSAAGTVVRMIEQYPENVRGHIRNSLAGSLRGVVCQELIPSQRGVERILAAEVMLVNAQISGMIAEDRAWQIPSVMKAETMAGMSLMDEQLERLVRDQRITIEEAVDRATDCERFLQPTETETDGTD